MPEMKFDGLAGIRANLQKMPERVGRNAMRRALRKGANVIRDAARANARQIDDPQTRDMIQKNVAVQAGRKRDEERDGGPKMRVGVMGGARPLKKGSETGLPGGNTTHWRFIEFGTSEARAQPFMRPAMESGAARALETTAAAMQTEVNKELAKL